MDPRRVIRSYLIINGLFTLSASLIWGINTLFLLHADLSIFEVFVANAAFTAAMALFEVPTGVVADTLGRRVSFLLSEATLAAGTLAYVGVAAIHGGLLLFCLAGVILGLGYTFYSGAVEAWRVAALKATGSRHELDGVIASLFALAGIAGNAMVKRLAIPGRRRTTILLGAAAVSTATMVATGVIRSFWITVPVFLFGAIAGGVLQPVRQTYLHHSIPTSERATLVSFDSLVGSLGSVGGQTGLGFLSQEQSIPVGFVVGGLATFLAIPIFGRLRALDEPADRITAEAPEAEPSPIHTLR